MAETGSQNELTVTKGEGWEEGILRDNVHVHTAMLKMQKQQGPTGRPGTSAQCYVAAWMGGGLEQNGYMYMDAESLCCPP